MQWIGGTWGWGSAAFMLLMVGAWLIIVAAAIWGITTLTQSGRHMTISPQDPGSELDLRFGRGEIGATEYQRARNDLNAKSND
jgi:uncharacterized membrane protein